MPKNSNSGSDLATYIASNAELLTEQNYTDIDALVYAEIIPVSYTHLTLPTT